MNQALENEILSWKDQYAFFTPFGLGDTLEVCSYMKEIRERLGGGVRLIVKRPHEFIARDCGISNYATADSLGIMDGSRSHVANLAALRSELGQFISDEPARGRLYVAHPGCNTGIPRNKELLDLIGAGRIGFNDFYRKFFGIEDMQTSVRRISLDGYVVRPELRAAVEAGTGQSLSDSVLAIFECRSSAGPSLRTKAELLDVMRNEHPGAAILADDQLPGISLRDLMSIAANVRHVYAWKSGLCDVLVNLGSRMTVFYANRSLYDVFSAQTMFERHEVDERVL